MARKTSPPESTAAEPAKDGRPTDYLPAYVEPARKLCAMGATDIDLAEAFGVSDRTIRRWRLAQPEFADACRAGKALWDDGVEEALRRRATGYDYESEKVYCEGGKVTRVRIIEHVPPDGWSAFKWLCNRRPDLWRDKVDVMATVRPADVTSNPLSPDEWDRQYGGTRAN